jgi:hypothetical protein
MRATASARLLLVALSLVLSGCVPHGPTTSAFDGVYQGTGYLTDPGLQTACDLHLELKPMKVTEGRVEFGDVTGWVQPNGNLHMVYGRQWFDGQFNGTRFQGRVWRPGLPCSYRLEMNRVS